MEDALWGVVQIALGALVQFLVPILIVAVIGWLGSIIQQIRVRVGTEKWRAIEEATRLAVLAIEQSGLKDAVIKTGNEKKDLAIAVAQAYLAERGIKVDLGVLADLIEAAVAETLNYDKVIAPKD